MIFEFFFSTILDYLNDKNWKDEIPENLKEFYDKKNYTKARDYKIETGTQPTKQCVLQSNTSSGLSIARATQQHHSFEDEEAISAHRTC